MQIDDSTVRKLLSRDFMNAVIRIGLIAFLVVMCVRVFAPFANLVSGGIIGMFVGAVLLAVGHQVFMD